MSSSLPLVFVGREWGQRDTMLGNIKLGENKIFDAEEIKRFLLESPLPPPKKKPFWLFLLIVVKTVVI